MRLNLFKSIVSILVLFASGFIIAHADEELELGDCRGLNSCEETAGTFCTSMGIWVYKVASTYQKCPDCTNDGTFGLFTPICGDASVYYSCSRQGTGPGLAYTRTEWFKNIVVADHFNYNCHAQCSCGGGDPPRPECSPGSHLE